MAQIAIHKQKFKEYLQQFKDDVPYQIELLQQLLNQLPESAIEGFITEYFYTHGYYKGELYKIQHVIFKDDIRYFTSLSSLTEYLKNYTLDKKVQDALTEMRLKWIIKNNQTVAGYSITKVSD